LGALIAEFRCVNSGEKMLPGTEKGRRNGQVHFVNQPFAKILPDGCDSATQPDVLTVRGTSRSFQCGVDSVGYKMEGSSPAHGDRCARVMGEHEYGSMERRVVAPPPLPVFVGPGTSDRSEHVSTNDPCADVAKAARREFIICAGCSAILARHLPKSACGDGPFVKRGAADTERIGEILAGARTVAIEGYSEAVNAKFGHACSLGRSGLDVGHAFGAGAGKMFFVPGDGAVDGIDLVAGFGEAVAFAGITDKDGFDADVFEGDKKLFGFGDGHVVIVFAVQEHRGGVDGGDVFEGGALPGHVHEVALVEELAELHFLVLVVVGHVVVADEVRDSGGGDGGLEFVGLGDEPVGELPAVADALDSHPLAVNPEIPADGGAHAVEDVLALVAVLIAED